MSDPKLAEALNPRLALNKRMAAEGQALPALPDKLPSASDPKFGKQWSPEERARQNAALAKLLADRK
jgi:hypothetical protein